MAAPTIECTCPYEILSRKNRNYGKVWDLALDRDAAIIIGPILSFGVKNVDFEGIEVFKTNI